jgi:four helix bundle protein
VEQIPLPKRTKDFSVRIIRLYNALPKSADVRVIANQLMRSGTSVGAHCREAFRGRSDKEMISKLEAALQELDESIYWMELLIEIGSVKVNLLEPLIAEANELMAIIVTSVKTVKARL